VPAFPCLSCPSFTTPTSLSRPAMPVLVPPVPSFPDRTFRRLPYLIDPIRDFPNPTITRPNSPCLPDLNSPCITFRLATLTHLACRACVSVSRLSALASPISPSLPPQSLPDPDARRQSAFAIPCLLLLAYPSFPDPSFSYAVLPDLPNRAI